MLKINSEKIIDKILFLSAALSIIIVFLLTAVIFLEGQKALVNWFIYGFGFEYEKTENAFGIIPLVFVSLYLGVGSTLFASIIGIPCSIYLSEFIPGQARRLFKQVFEMMTSFPSIIIGLFGFVIISNLTYIYFGAASSVFSGWIALTIMSLPYIITISDDALKAVPESFKEASLALGASHWQTIRHIMIPNARNGLITAIFLTLGRAVGETTAVALTIGGARPDASLLTLFPFISSNCVTTKIIDEIGDTAPDSLGFSSLYGMAMVLLFLIFLLNLAAQRLRR